MDYSPNFIAMSYRPNNHEVDSTEPFRAGTSMTQYPSSVPLSQHSHDLDFSPRKPAAKRCRDSGLSLDPSEGGRPLGRSLFCLLPGCFAGWLTSAGFSGESQPITCSTAMLTSSWVASLST